MEQTVYLSVFGGPPGNLMNYSYPKLGWILGVAVLNSGVASSCLLYRQLLAYGRFVSRE